MGPGSASRTRWRLILGDGGDDADAPPSADGPTNMAIDQALLASVRDGAAPALRFYRWDPPTLSFGRNQPARGLYDQDDARARGIAFVRRPTGGQAVLHADELTYSVVARVEALGKPRQAYARINHAVVEGLRSLGLAASVAEGLRSRSGARTRARGWGGSRAPGRTRGRDWRRACFRAASAGEVVVGGRKVVGSAQRCEGRTILQHGSILLAGSQSPAEELLLAGEVVTLASEDDVVATASDTEPGWSTLEDEMGSRPALEELVRALTTGFMGVIGTRFAPTALATTELKDAAESRRQFTAPEWTWRR